MKEIIEQEEAKIRYKKQYLILHTGSEIENDTIYDQRIVTSGITTQSHYEVLKQEIDDAKETIMLSTFLFDDIDLAHLLIKAADRLKGGVYILTSILDDKLLDEYNFNKSDRNKHLEVIRLLQGTRVSVKSVPHLHAKFWTIDSKRAVVTSANLTERSLREVAELGVIIANAESVRQLEHYFQRLWFEFATEKAQDGRILGIRGFQGTPYFVDKDLEELSYDIYRETDNKQWEIGDWYDTFHHLVKNAEDEIIIATYSIYLKGSKLLPLLREKLDNGIKVRILVANYVFRRKSGTRDQLIKLKNGYQDLFEFYVHNSNHAKFLIIDNRRALVSTKNYGKKGSFDQSFEIGYLSDKYVEDLLHIWEHLVSECDSIEWVTDRNEYYQNLAGILDLDLYFDDIIIWIWTPAKAVFNWVRGPSVQELIDKIESAAYLKYFELKNGKKI